MIHKTIYILWHHYMYVMTSWPVDAYIKLPLTLHIPGSNGGGGGGGLILSLVNIRLYLFITKSVMCRDELKYDVKGGSGYITVHRENS